MPSTAPTPRPTTLHPSSPTGGNQRQGVLVVAADETQRDALQRDITPLKVDMLGCASGEEALALLMGDEAPDVLVIGGDPADMSGLQLCQRVRADARLAATYVLLLAEAQPDERTYGRGPDEHLTASPTGDVVRVAVRGGIRAQALRRMLARHERRRAIGWLGHVIGHELNNPLCVAVAAQQRIEEILAAPLDEAATCELRELTAECGAVLGRMKQLSSRLRSRGRVSAGSIEEVTLPDFVARLRETVAATGREHRVSADRRTSASASFDADLILEAIAGVLAATAVFDGGMVDVRVHLDACRVAVIVEVPGVLGIHPESLLEARLSYGEDGPARLDQGLSSLEECFERHGGQLFASRHEGRWRFGLTLPFAPAAVP